MRLFLALFLLLLFSPAWAQDETGDIDSVMQQVDQQAPDDQVPEQQKATPIVVQNDNPVPVPSKQPASAPQYETKKFAVLQTLDKLTARTNTVTLPVGKPSAVGPIFIDVKTCKKTPPSEQPESAAFLQIWEAKPKSKDKNATSSDNDAPSQWVFSGWMFASSPALSAMDHPVYDVWLKDCVNEVATSQAK